MQSKRMAYSLTILLTHNYFEWKLKILHQLKCRELYRITMATEVEPTLVIEKNEYLNRMDEAYDLIYMSMSPELLFHIEASTTPDEIWTKLEDLFGKQDEMRVHMLEVELNSLDQRNFYNIQGFFTKFKSLLLHLKGCGVDKSTQHNQLIISILSERDLQYVVFVSTFHTVRCTSGATWEMPTLDQFIESLTHEQDQLKKMWAIKRPNAHALVVHESNSGCNPKTKQKGKGKAHYEHKKEGNSKSLNDSYTSKGGKGKKGKPKCSYYHPKTTCIPRLGDYIPENAKKKSGDQPPNKRRNYHALIAIHSSLDAWILDSGTSHHMET
jgi:hypothetical protein